MTHSPRKLVMLQGSELHSPQIVSFSFQKGVGFVCRLAVVIAQQQHGGQPGRRRGVVW